MYILEVRNEKIGNEKYLYWKLISKLVIGSIEISNGHGPSGPPYSTIVQTMAVVEFHLISDVGISFSL